MNPKLYDISESVYTLYISQVKRGASATIEVVARKLSAIINNCPRNAVCKDDENRVKHFFPDFYLITDEKKNTIFWIDWQPDYVYHNNFLSKACYENLKKDYIYFGLSNSGNSFRE